MLEPPVSDQFLAGIQAGLARAERSGLQLPEAPKTALAIDDQQGPGDLPPALAAAHELTSQADVSGRFTELFAEMVTVAVAARHTYGDEALTEQQLDEYFQHSLSIFNSFRHA